MTLPSFWIRSLITIICLCLLCLLHFHLPDSTSLHHQTLVLKRYVISGPDQSQTDSTRKDSIIKGTNGNIDNIDFDYRNKSLSANFQLKVWNSDFHISPTADCKWIFQQYGVDIVDKSLSGHCHLMNSCQTDLRIINKDNGINSNPCPNKLRKSFYESYKNDDEMNSIDMFLCTHAASMCELFMPFNKPMIVIASTRYEIGRHEIHRWKEWNANLERIASKPYNVIAANNLYDLVSSSLI